MENQNLEIGDAQKLSSEDFQLTDKQLEGLENFDTLPNDSPPFTSAAFRYNKRGALWKIHCEWYRYLEHEIVPRHLELDENPGYMKLRGFFEKMSHCFIYSTSCAIAFWHDILELSKSEGFFSDIVTQRILLCGMINYGDFFTFTLNQHIPKGLIQPSDLYVEETVDDVKKAFGDTINLRAEFLDQTEFRIASNPFRIKGITNYQDFARLYFSHMDKQHYFYAYWIPAYQCVEENTNLAFAGSTEEVFALAQVFRQYIDMLGEHKNSAHKKFHPDCWDYFQEGCILYVNLERLLCLLEDQPLIAQIGPAYLTILFRHKATELYSKEELHIEKILPVEKFTTRREVKLYANLKSNFRHPENTCIALYKILCAYFKYQADKNKKIDPAKNSSPSYYYNETLCDYIMESTCPYIGQPTAVVTAKHISKILHQKQHVPSCELIVNHTWFHPLLEKINDRLEQSLHLNADYIYRLVPLNNTYIRPTYEDLGRKLVDDAFFDSYLKTLILDPEWLTNKFPSFAKKIAFAELLDNAINASKNPLLHNLLDSFMEQNKANDAPIPDWMMCLESGVHRTCSEKLFYRYYPQVIQLLYRYLYTGMIEYTISD